MAWGTIAGAGLSALGSVAGGLIGSSGDKEASKQLDRQLAAGSARLITGNREAREYNAPYYNLGLIGTPLLQYYTTGAVPAGYEWGDGDEAELNTLLNREAGMRSQLADLNGKLSVAGTSHASRHYQEAYGPQAASVEFDLKRLDELKNRKQVAQMFSGVKEGGILGEASPYYDWQREQGENTIDRFLASRNMYNSRAGINALSDFQNRLGAEETERQYGRILNLVDIGRGAASSNANAAISAGQTGAQMATSMAPAMASLTQSAAQQRGSMWANALSAPLSYMNTQSYINALNPNSTSSYGTSYLPTNGGLGGYSLGNYSNQFLQGLS